MQVMKNIKEDLLEDTEYAPKMIFNNLVFQAINSTLPHARENCTDIAQGQYLIRLHTLTHNISILLTGFDVLFARFGDVDFVSIYFTLYHVTQATLLKHSFLI